MEIRLEPDRSIAKRWGFEADFEMPSGHCSRVYASADRVLKVPFQGEEMSSGRVAAVAMSGSIGPRVLESDEATGAVLMERMTPGSDLATSDLSESERVDVSVRLALEVRDLRSGIERWMPLSDFMKYSKCPYVPELLATSPTSVLLHGDLHHFNILRHGERWLAIDPKGLYGDPAFEAAAYVRNPIPNIADEPNLLDLLSWRVETLARRLEVSPDRVLRWSLAEIWDEEPSTAWGKVKDALMQLS